MGLENSGVNASNKKGRSNRNLKIWRFRRAWLIRGVLAAILIALLSLGALVVVVSSSPYTGTQGADLIRNLLGPKPVAFLEGIVFSIQDMLHQAEFKISEATPAAPWQVTVVPVSTPTVLSSPTRAITETSTALPTLPATSSTSPAIIPTAMPTPITPTSSPSPTATQGWMPAAVQPLGNITGEGEWTPYIQDQAGETVAYKTFLQPDPERPYVIVGIVAFDLTRVHLHYVLGTEEPTGAVDPYRTGQIPHKDLKPGFLLAAFNGGFKTVNGYFGVLIHGITIVPPIQKMGTLAIYKDGSLRIGEWGTDLTYSSDMVVFRQNCPLLVHNGEINPLVYNNSVNDWGGTINGAIVTFRSGIGTSQDGKTLYYFAGQSLNMASLAKAMLDTGNYQAMQLDINNYYVIFTKIQVENGQMVGVPLLPKDMVSNLNRFLATYSRDFFYITSNNP